MENVKQEVIEDLKRLPQIMHDKNVELYTKRKQFDELNYFIKKKELKVMQEVTDEINDSGKPVYSNQTKRDIECTARLEKDNNYVNDSITRDNVKLQIDNLNIEMEFYNNKFKSARALSRLL